MQMHLLGFLMNTPINHMAMSWADPRDDQLSGLTSFRRWQETARLMERACFDGVFFADVPSVYDNYKGSPDEAMRYGVSWPTHDPVGLIGAMAAATEHLGFAVTVSVASQHPFLLVRTISTLDVLSGGRVGWNVVTGNALAEHRAVGLEVMEHDQRYDRAEEYMALVYELWDAIQPGAIRMDRAKGVFADPEKIRRIAFEGKYFRCHTTPSVLPSPQGRPLVFQAGTSDRGRRFAVQHSDVIFSIQNTWSGMNRFVSQIRDTASAMGTGRDPHVLFAIQPFLGGTEEEARRLRDGLIARIPLDAALTRISGTLGIDFSKLDLDQPLEAADTQASRGLMAVVSDAMREKGMTIREAITRYGMVGSIPQVVGTPEQVADQLEKAWRESGCHGFNITPAIHPQSLSDFAEQVVPILQRRGIFRTEYDGTTFRQNLFGAA